MHQTVHQDIDHSKESAECEYPLEADDRVLPLRTVKNPTIESGADDEADGENALAKAPEMTGGSGRNDVCHPA